MRAIVAESPPDATIGWWLAGDGADLGKPILSATLLPVPNPICAAVATLEFTGALSLTYVDGVARIKEVRCCG